MKTKLLTDIELRAHWSRDRSDTYCVAEGTILTPSARDFLREHGIRLRFTLPSGQTETMTTTPLPTRNGKAVYRDAATGWEMDRKPEEMTHLRGNLLVPKIHPQIEFRGRLDSLMAKTLNVQLAAEECGLPQMVADLEELLSCMRRMLAAEVKDEPLAEICLMGMNSQEIRHNSHFVKSVYGIDHPVPNYKMGRVCIALNDLRTQVRETELSAARAFCQPDGTFQRTDIIEGLNRLSSCVYIILCRKLSGYYDRGNRS